MPDQLEEALTRTLSDAAEATPAHPPGLAHEVDVRFRRRRRRRYAAVAGVAAFAVIGGSALAAGVVTGKGGPGPSTVGVPAAAPGELPPVADVWPEAVHKVSAKLADGRKYRIERMVDDRRLLIATEASFENANELWLLDLSTSKAHRVVTLPKPHEGGEVFASHFTTGSGQIVWWDAYSEDGKAYTRIWKAPLEGGEPTLVSTVTGPYGTGGPAGDRLLVHGDHVYFSHSTTGGVRKVPLSGGKAELIEGTAGYHLVAWPWIGTPGENYGSGGPQCTLAPDGAPQCKAAENDRVACTLDPVTEEPICPDETGGSTGDEPAAEHRPRIFTKLRSLETGEERVAKLPKRDMQSVYCGVTYCFGAAQDGKWYSWNRDGTGERTLPGPADFMMGPPGWDRFVFIANEGDSSRLYDLKTGKSADLGITAGPDGGMQVPGLGTADRRDTSWWVDGQQSYIVVDLAAIK